ncbi:hypothetical protein V865_006207 [Kwoniella europaea PYCC6329]|uniref:BRCT domain-containing protein n=1 Tax=Kwoniella europaea PYCC6329 TaxID=1423913 RepID=A0AAX4KNL3_9TREE
MTSRRIGPRIRPSMPPESQSQSQTQESTQQPSIEVRPSSPITTGLVSSGPSSSQPIEESALVSGTSSLGQQGQSSLVEESADSGLGWTQSQIQQNKKENDHNNTREEGLQDIRERSEEGVITSPEIPSPGPKWNTKSPSPARAVQRSSPDPEVDVDHSEESAPNRCIGGLEETEVDTYTPHVQTPEQSQPPSTPPSRSHDLPQPPTIPNVTNPTRQLRAVTSYSPKKLTPKSKQRNGDLTKITQAHTAPVNFDKPMVSPSSRNQNGKAESLESEESDFAKEFTITKPRTPFEHFSGIMARTSHHNLSTIPDRSNLQGPSAISTEEEEEIEDHPPRSPKVPETNDGDTDEDDPEEEEGDAPINWAVSLPPANGSSTNLDDHHGSTSPMLSKQADANGDLSPLSSQLQTNGNQSRFNRVADFESQPSQQINIDNGNLFSDTEEGYIGYPESQPSLPPLAATQAIQQPSSSAIDSLHKESTEEVAYEPTQPDETQHNEPEQPIDGDQTDNDENPKSPSPPRLILSRAVSNISTASKVSVVPSHRQLSRKPKVDHDSFASRVKFDPPTYLPPTVLPPRASALPPKPNLSEAALAPLSSSPFEQLSLHRTSSEPPALQETLKNSLDKESSSIGNKATDDVSSNNRVASSPSERLNRVFTPPPGNPSSPFRPLPTPSSPSLEAARQSDAPASPTALEETQKNSPALPPARPVKVSPRQYTNRNKRKRISSTPPVGYNSDSSTDSSSAPEDQEDHTYRPEAANKKRKKTYAASNTSSKPAATPDTTVIPSLKRKRKPVVRSSSLSSDGESSSSAPEDLEDNTYQPSLLPKIKIKTEKGKGKANASAPSSTASSRPPITKKAKTNALVARLSPTVSTASEATVTPQPIPVLAAFFQRYYPGKATWTGKAYKVNFEDGEKRDHIKPDQMRKLVLKKGDRLEACTESAFPPKFEVAEDWDGDLKGVKCCTMEGVKLGRVKLNLFGITNKVIHASFGDRLFEDPHQEAKKPNGIFGPAVDRMTRRISVPRSPVKRVNGYGNGSPAVSRRSVSPTRLTSETLKGTLFLLTRGFPDDQAEITGAIRSHGGQIASSWEELFDRSSPGECGLSKNLSGTPFVILMGEGKEGTIITPKVMVALAKGIPVLSSRFVDDIVDQNEKVDWRSYLISPGFSNYVEHYMSQVVDTHWGEDGWEAHIAGPIRRPLKGKKVLFVLPSAKYDSLKRLIPVCAYSMGVEEILLTPNFKSSETTIQDDKWDYILFEDREYKDKIIPTWLSSEEDRLCNIHWLKQCLIMGKALPPSLDVEPIQEKDKKKEK